MHASQGGLAAVGAAGLHCSWYVRAHTELPASRSDVGLVKDTTEIECAETGFPGIARSFWLPREADVTSLFRNMTYSNRHRYSDYRLFVVETRDKVNPPVSP